MLANSENSESTDRTTDYTMENTEESNHKCVNCRQSIFKRRLSGYDFDTGTKTFYLESCSNCELTRTAPILDDSELSSYYESGYYGSSEQKFNPLIEAWTVWSNNRLAKKIFSSAIRSVASETSKTKVLDVGCGRANLLKAFKSLGCDCYGVERTDFPSDDELDGISIYKQDINDIPFEENEFDIVVIWHVLEHLVDPVTTLKRIQKILKPDGSLIIAVPNYGGLQSRLFGKHWFHLDLPRHTYHFTESSLKNITNKNGLTIESISTSSLDQSLFGFIQSAANMLHLGKPNTLYEILKTAQNKSTLLMKLLQLFTAGALLPFAIVEYLLSTITGTGACLIVKVDKK